MHRCGGHNPGAYMRLFLSFFLSLSLLGCAEMPPSEQLSMDDDDTTAPTDAIEDFGDPSDQADPWEAPEQGLLVTVRPTATDAPIIEVFWAGTEGTQEAEILAPTTLAPGESLSIETPSGQGWLRWETDGLRRTKVVRVPQWRVIEITL